MKKIFSIIFCFSLLLGCNKDTTTFNTEMDSEVTFTTNITSVTRVTSDIFDNNDEIYVSAYDNGALYAELKSYIYNDATFTSTSPIYYEDTDQKLSYIAVYPALSDFDTEFTFEANTDQSSGDNYELSDLLVATLEETNEINPSLDFYHQMSSIVLTVNDEIFDNGTVVFNLKNGVTIDVIEGTYAATGDAVEITPASNGTLSFKVIVAPQSIAADAVIATYTAGGVGYQWVSAGNVELVSGYRYSYSWDIETDSVVMDGYIEGWNDNDFYADAEYPATVIYVDASLIQTDGTYTGTDTLVSNATWVVTGDVASSASAWVTDSSNYENLQATLQNYENVTLDLNGVTSFGGVWALSYCPAIVAVDMSSYEGEVTNALFACCTNLVSVALPSTMTLLNANFVAYCTSLETLTGTENIVSFGSNPLIDTAITALDLSADGADDDGTISSEINTTFFSNSTNCTLTLNSTSGYVSGTTWFGVTWKEIWIKGEEPEVATIFKSIGYITPAYWAYDDHIETIDWSNLSHVIVSFIQANSDGSIQTSTTSADTFYDSIEYLQEKGAANNFKVMVAIQSSSTSSLNFYNAVSDETKRATLIANIIAFVKEYDLDGIDVDFEEYSYVGTTGFKSFITELRTAVDALAVELEREVIYSAAVAPNISGYPSDLGTYVDFINLMNYDFSAYSSVNAQHASLSSFKTYTSATYAEKYGATKRQLIGGLPFYGYSYDALGANETATAASATQYAYWQIFAAYLAYGYDASAIAAANQMGNTIYDGQELIAEKCQYVIDNSFGGVMVWQLGQDLLDAYEDYKLLPVIGATIGKDNIEGKVDED